MVSILVKQADSEGAWNTFKVNGYTYLLSFFTQEKNVP